MWEKVILSINFTSRININLYMINNFDELIKKDFDFSFSSKEVLINFCFIILNRIKILYISNA